MIRTVVITPPAAEPVELATAKAHAKIEVSDDDALVAGYIGTARELVETRTGRALIERSLAAYLPWFPSGCERDRGAIVLPFPPLLSVESITYLPASGGAEVTLAADKYVVDLVSAPGRVVLKSTASWPDTLDHPNAVRVNYTAGYGNDPTDVPFALRQAIQVLVADMYDNRSPVPTNFAMDQMRLLCTPFEVGRIWG